MEMARKNGFLSRRVTYLPIEQVYPDPAQPRREMERSALQELSESIRAYGILQPLTVRRAADGYEVIAGQRRLRAARLAGLREVPCLMVHSGEEESSLLAVIEALQRRDLHYLDEAAAIAELISSYGLSQEQAAEKLGRSQSAIANKLRLLRLSSDCTRLLRENGLSERHARALLRLCDDEERLAALRVIIENHCNVERTEEFIEKLVGKQAVTPPHRRTAYIIKDVRIFLNGIARQLDIMQRAGVAAEAQRQDTEEEIRILIRIPRKKERKG